MTTRPTTPPPGADDPGDAASATSAPSAPSSTLPAAPRTNQTIVILLIIIAVLLAVIAAFLVRGLAPGGAGPAVQAGSAPSTTAGTTADAAASAAATPAGPSAQETSAPTQTDPKAVELIRAQVRRDPADNRARGKVDAPVVMVIYSDFGCPYCTQFAQEVAPELDDLVEEGTLRIEWRDLAQITETSPLAAQAGIAAANQGRFWEFHDAVYAAADPYGHPEYTEESLVGLATRAGVPDLERFRADMSAQETVDAVDQATRQAHQIGITGTPFLLVGDTYISGYRPAPYVRATILEQAAAQS